MVLSLSLSTNPCTLKGRTIIGAYLSSLKKTVKGIIIITFQGRLTKYDHPSTQYVHVIYIQIHQVYEHPTHRNPTANGAYSQYNMDRTIACTVN